MIKVALGTWIAKQARAPGIARMRLDGSGLADRRFNYPDSIRRRALRRQNIMRAPAFNADLVSSHEFMALQSLERLL